MGGSEVLLDRPKMNNNFSWRYAQRPQWRGVRSKENDACRERSKRKTTKKKIDGPQAFPNTKHFSFCCHSSIGAEIKTFSTFFNLSPSFLTAFFSNLRQSVPLPLLLGFCSPYISFFFLFQASKITPVCICRSTPKRKSELLDHQLERGPKYMYSPNKKRKWVYFR